LKICFFEYYISVDRNKNFLKWKIARLIK